MSFLFCVTLVIITGHIFFDFPIFAAASNFQLAILAQDTLAMSLHQLTCHLLGTDARAPVETKNHPSSSTLGPVGPTLKICNGHVARCCQGMPWYLHGSEPLPLRFRHVKKVSMPRLGGVFFCQPMPLIASLWDHHPWTHPFPKGMDNMDRDGKQ